MIRMMALVVAVSVPSVALAQNPFGDLGKKALDTAAQEGSKAAKGELNKGVVKKLNAKLLAEGRKNQCSFKVDSDELAPGCDAKAKKLANTIIEVKKALVSAGFSGFKFEVSGHTDSTGDAARNKELSQKRAAAIVREMVARGVPQAEIEAVGMGAEKLLVKPDNTPAKKAKNRRYEIQIKL